MNTQPAFFISHGGPTFVVADIPARHFLAGLGDSLQRPEAIVTISAHWETDAPRATSSAQPETIHDFYGFPEEFYRLRYPAPGAPDLAARTVALLKEAGYAAATDAERGLDHGAWEPLMLMYPKADVPVTQLSIQFPRGPAHHMALGRALEPLRRENVLVLASGTATHNLRALDRREDDKPSDWTAAFDSWLTRAVESGDEAALADYRKQAPYAEIAHPRDEHLMPLFVAFGAGGGRPGRKVHGSFSRGTMSMSAFAFD